EDWNGPWRASGGSVAVHLTHLIGRRVWQAVQVLDVLSHQHVRSAVAVVVCNIGQSIEIVVRRPDFWRRTGAVEFLARRATNIRSAGRACINKIEREVGI